MNKRILTLVLALVMILGLAVTSFAAPEAEKITNPKVQWLIDKNIVVGRLQDDGKTTVYDLDKTITREEVAKLVILYRGSENLARSLQGTKGIFKDVAIDRWSNGYINVAALADLIVGYPDGNFGPDKDITYAEIAAILVRMNSKWTAADEKAAIWPISFIKAAEEFGILKGIKLEDANAPAVREKVFEMMYNAFDGKYQAPIVNDRLGVISKVWGNSIQLNGDAEYKITDKTIFVGDTLNKLFKANDFFGSLVRIAVNDENEVTHLIALGSKGFAYAKYKWEGLIDEKYGDVYVVESSTIKSPADIKATSDNDKVEFVGGTTLKITDKTRFFVADPSKNNFFEAKKLSDAINTKEPAHLKGVYAAYDEQPVTGEKYAKVVVFSSGKEAPANKNLARITASVGAGYDFRAENTGAVETEYSVAKVNQFPYNYKLHKMDVVNLYMSGDKDVVNFKTVIDYDNAPVFEVVSVGSVREQKDGTVKFRGNEITLKDKHDQELPFALDVDGVSVFVHTVKAGDKVQVSYSDKAKQVIDVISVVDKKVDGEFPGYEPGKICGTVASVDATFGPVIRIKLDKNYGDLKKGQIAQFEIGLAESGIVSTTLEKDFGLDLTSPAPANHVGKDLIALGWNIDVCGIVTAPKEGAAITKLTFNQAQIDACQKEFKTFENLAASYDLANVTGTWPTVSFSTTFPPGYDLDKQVDDAQAIIDAYNALSPCAKGKVKADNPLRSIVAVLEKCLEGEAANPRPTHKAVNAHIKFLEDEVTKLVAADAKFKNNTDLTAHLNNLAKTSLVNAITVTDGGADPENPGYTLIKIAIQGKNTPASSSTINTTIEYKP